MAFLRQWYAIDMGPVIPTTNNHQHSDDDDAKTPNMYIEIDIGLFIMMILTRWCHCIPLKTSKISVIRMKAMFTCDFYC